MAPYPYSDEGGYSEAEQAQDVDGNAGACPPVVVEYRIYPEFDFNLLFGTPPDTVDWE